MKNAVIKSVLLAFVAIMGSSILLMANAQSKAPAPKVYALINRADRCPVCQANGARVMNEVIPACKDLKVQFVSNDLTNEQTKTKSVADLKEIKVHNAVKETSTTGVILLVDAKTKKIVKQISVSKPSEESIKEITAAQS